MTEARLAQLERQITVLEQLLAARRLEKTALLTVLHQERHQIVPFHRPHAL